MKNIFRLFALILVLVAIPTLSWAESITIGTIERPPFMIKNSNELSGFAIEIWKEVAQRADLSYKFQTFEKFGEMLDSVNENVLDMAIANITITSEREQKFDFSQPIYNSGLQILTTNNKSSVSFLKIIWESGIV